MVRRLLLTLVVATLLLALPASAQDGSSDPGTTASDCLPSGPLSEACATTVCPPVDPCESLACPTLETCESACLLTETCQEETANLELFSFCEVVHADPATSADEPLTLDRDGCVRGIIRNLLGWPPAQVACQLSVAAPVLRLL